MKTKRTVYGVGVNDSSDPVFNCPFYSRWRAMLKRCYVKSDLDRMPSYSDCYVSDEWLLFSNFKEWMKEQNWKDKHLDKDILFPGNKVYSENTCIFVDARINTLLNDCLRSRGKWPVGVHYHSRDNAFASQCMSLDGKKTHLGYFDNPWDAHKEYLKYKSRAIREAAKSQPPSIRSGLNKHAKIMEDKIKNVKELTND